MLEKITVMCLFWTEKIELTEVIIQHVVDIFRLLIWSKLISYPSTKFDVFMFSSKKKKILDSILQSLKYN